MDEARQGTADKLIRNVFRYMDKNARDIMTHRKNIVAIDEEESLEDALHFMLETNYSRFPIYRGSIDEIIGFMHLREAMTCYLKNNYRNVPVKELHSYIRPVDFIPESKNIDRLFKEMQAKKNHIVIVMDEYGQTSGLVTLEAILEEIGDLLHVIFDTEEYGTLNGFMIDKLERIPNEGEECIVVYKNYRFTVLEVNDNTIQRVKIEKLPMA